MSLVNAGRRRALKGLSAAAATFGAGAIALPRSALAADQIQLISHRYPALEFWAGKMKTALPGVDVNAQLMPFEKMGELVTIAMSSKASTFDIVYVIDSSVASYARNGWLRPLDDLWAKYKNEFNLGDFSDAAMKMCSYNGRIYALPGTVNVMMLYYRKDLLDAAGKPLPRSVAEYQALAKALNSPARAGAISCLKPTDATMNEAHWYMNTIGQGWFDSNWKPIFNNEAGVRAIEALKESTRAAQRGFATAANDECTIALQQDAAAMGMQWATRARSVDDPKQSRAAGKFEWAPMPQGHARVLADGYAISAFSKQDPDQLFRIMATATREANMREAAGMLVPPRKALLNDPELRAKNRFYPAAAQAIETGTPFPALPEFYAVGEFVSRRILQAVTGEMSTKQAMDEAAGETEAYLKGRGYYR
ncbi:extracellular solute-binding protein [Variovorax ginsengisoli]|uniref:Extracellular solute-binding protein n=1 Tax=Variovorax ginsengisoli TaxID=363844 RepID=A0ABT8S572_9BURK|nr:extracellular solute-binding protein [Variovorax ginsengisoli]MDN8614899.1 extracellular solute-binding protein [Variovorax ginsengisoli]MDO1534069.1 extracellular solute-binding protein [Variovorax ginsengisoli]